MSNDYEKRQEASSDTIPAQNGTVSAKGIAVAQQILDGMYDSEGKQVYFSYQPTAPFEDATTQYDSTTGSWELDISALGAEFVARFLQLTNSSTLDSLDGYTYDTIKDLMIEGWHMYSDTLQTDWPDLTTFHESGGKGTFCSDDAPTTK